MLAIQIFPDKTYDHEIIPIYTDASGIRLRQGEERAAVLRRFDQLSAVSRDDVLCKRQFYHDAARPVRKMSRHMGDMIRKRGLIYILSRLHRVQMEDLKIKLHSMIKR